jgi:hypothetical protein
MKKLFYLTFIFLSFHSFAQKNKEVNYTIPLSPNKWDFKAGEVDFTEYKGKKVMKLTQNSGLVVLKDLVFKDGTIEFEVESILPSFAQSIYFRRKDDKEQEIVYLRLGNIGKKLANDAIQYCPYFDGVNMWDMYPQYQAPAPILKEDWNHIKLVISGRQMRVYMNKQPKPVLEVPQLEGNLNEGSIAFEGAAYITNVQVKPNQTEGLSPSIGTDLTQHEANYIRNWAITKPILLPSGSEVSSFMFPSNADFSESIEAERMGLISLTRKYGGNSQRRVVFLRAMIESEKDQKVNLGLGFSDEVWVYLNKQMVFVDKNLYLQNMRKYPNGRISHRNSTVLLNLKKGQNEITIAVANDFYGWGIIARLEETEGILSIEKYNAPPKIKIENTKLYLGSYNKKGTDFKINVFEKDENLYAQATGQEAFKIEYKGQDTFLIEALNVEFKFEPQQKRIILKQNGSEQIFEKE